MENIPKVSTGRISWIDMAKGYGILFVIIGHLRCGLVVYKWIYTFHIPLFFLLSGYVFSPKGNFYDFFVKKCKSIVIPYFCLGLPLLFYEYLNYFCTGGYSYSDYMSLFLQFLIQKRLWTIWFLACLFIVNIAFFLAKKILKTNKFLAIFSVVSAIIGLMYYKYINVPLPWNIDICFMAFPFFFAGHFYKENCDAIDNFLVGKIPATLLFILLALINLVCGYLTYKISGQALSTLSISMIRGRYGCAPLTFLSAFAGIACVIIVSKWTSIRAIEYVGRYSMLYFAWHQTIMIPISVAILSYFKFSIAESTPLGVFIAYKFAQLLIILIFITICNEIIRRTKLKFMLGIK